ARTSTWGCGCRRTTPGPCCRWTRRNWPKNCQPINLRPETVPVRKRMSHRKGKAGRQIGKIVSLPLGHPPPPPAVIPGATASRPSPFAPRKEAPERSKEAPPSRTGKHPDLSKKHPSVVTDGVAADLSPT